MTDIVLNSVNGWVVLPSSLKAPTGVPRFNLEFPVHFKDDPGAHHLVVGESQLGYEAPTRNLLEKVLRAGDFFIDVGAHWGLFSLQAVTHPCGRVRAIAFEPDPLNASVFFRNIVANGHTETAQLVCAACGDDFDIAPLVANATMMHSIRGVGLKPPFIQGASKWVPVVSLDTALAFFPHAGRARLILKVDAEGFEPQVIAGARGLLESGRVALIIWERGHGFADGPERAGMIEMVETLSRRGFRQVRPPTNQVDGPLVPFDVNDSYIGNVFALAAGLAL